MIKRLIAVGKIIFVVVFIFALFGCGNENQASSVEKIGDLDETMDKAEVDQVTQKSYINDKKEEKNQNTNQALEEKEELINEFTKELKNIQGRKVMYGGFLNDDHYVYVTTDQTDEQKERILIVSLNDREVKRRFEGGDLDKDGEPIEKIHKIFINRLNNVENPNVCVFRKNEKYTKVQIFEVNKNGKSIHYMGSCKRDNGTGEYIGDENYKYVMDFAFPSDYSSK